MKLTFSLLHRQSEHKKVQKINQCFYEYLNLGNFQQETKINIFQLFD